MLDKSVLFVENENELGLTNTIYQIDKNLKKKNKKKSKIWNKVNWNSLSEA